ncbi:hypothetical protein LINPERPRIM_LOCUS24872 [Linum perenne]
MEHPVLQLLGLSFGSSSRTHQIRPTTLSLRRNDPTSLQQSRKGQPPVYSALSQTKEESLLWLKSLSPDGLQCFKCLSIVLNMLLSDY